MDDTALLLRPAVEADVPRLVELIAGADLPPLFIPEHLDAFVVADDGQRVLACGAVEIYGRSGVIRSVVVDPAVRGAGMGLRLWERLEQDVRKGRLTDLYLFTGDAHDFWARLGFVDVTFEDWVADARLSWQYQFLSQNRHLFEGQPLHTMWRAA